MARPKARRSTSQVKNDDLYLMGQQEKEKIILGIDPGTVVMGFGIIKVQGSKMKVLQYGVLHLKKYPEHFLKLQKIYEKVRSLLDQYAPDHVALEAPFYGKNVQSMLKLGRAQGAAMVAALSKEIPVSEYAPKRVKAAVTGNGNASKEQVARMLEQLLNFKHEQKLLDATDALAVALAHHYAKDSPKADYGNWGDFLKAHPDRLK